MLYKQRSKYTPGGGVLAFFEQVSRFISLSVAGWIFLSVFFILFGTDSKVTDSFELKLFSNLFTDVQYFLATLMFIGMSGILGAVISIPSAVTLLLCRQYLDYQLLRLGSRRYSFVRERILRHLPVFVLVLSHVCVLLLSLASAPQLSRNWLSEGNKISEWLAGGHFVLTSLTRTAHLPTPTAIKSTGGAKSTSASYGAKGERIHLFFVPAELMDSAEFGGEIVKFNKAASVPFVIQRSSVNEQIEGLMLSLSGETALLARKTLALPKSYNRIISKNKSQTVVSISPQIRFGKELAGYGTEYLSRFNDSIMDQEAQRRLALSQIQLFGVFRAFNGVPFLSSNLQWLNLIADDVARIRMVSKLVSSLDPKKDSIIITQLFGLERVFSNVNPPFRPVGWQLNQASYEKRIVSKKLTRELFQYLSDFVRDETDHWLILPYADDKRLNPKSIAIFSQSDSMVSKHINDAKGTLFTSEDFAKTLGQGSAHERRVKSSFKPVTDTGPQLECFETELDLKNFDFSFQSIFNRERSLGQLLNYLPLMRDTDLNFLGRSGTSFVTRELGLGFLCRNDALGTSEHYLLKFRGSREQLTTSAGKAQFFSALVDWGHSRQSEKSKVKTADTTGDADQVMSTQVKINRSVLREFAIMKLTKDFSGPQGEEQIFWKLLDDKSTDFFFQRFERSVLEAIEMSARARIR